MNLDRLRRVQPICHNIHSDYEWLNACLDPKSQLYINSMPLAEWKKEWDTYDLKLKIWLVFMKIACVYSMTQFIFFVVVAFVKSSVVSTNFKAFPRDFFDFFRLIRHFN